MVTEAEPLQRELIARAIEAIAFNASGTLGGKHGDKLPLEHVAEWIDTDKGKKMLESLRGLLPFGSGNKNDGKTDK